MKFITIFDPKNEVNFVGLMPAMVKVSAGITAISLVCLVALGIPWGLDFTGGTEMQVKFSKAVTAAEVREVLAGAGFDKNQVQQFGTADDHEMLIRVERLTSLTDEHIARIRGVIEKNLGELAPGATAKPEDLEVSFRAEEGDKVTLRLPVPKVQAAPQKNSDEAAITAALTEKLGPPPAAPGAADAPTLDDATLSALVAQGYDGTAVVAKAGALGYSVTAAAAPEEAAVPEVVLQERALEAQEARLAELLDTESGAKLRRTRAAGETEASTKDALMRDEPYQGMVKYTVQFRGVGVDIERALKERFGEAEIRRTEFVDAQVAKQLQTDGLLALLTALLGILVYVAVRFDFFFSPGAVIALINDALGAMLLFTVARVEFELPSVAALLTVVGYSINSTIVIYDRIRETVPKDTKQPLTEEQVKGYVNKAINDTFSRTINTTLTTLFASLALFFFAGGVVRNFAAVLSVGITLGAFSSTFLAPAIYLYFRKNFEKPEAHRQKAGLTREDKARGVV